MGDERGAHWWAGCERERLHLSGRIQPHGALLALDLRDRRFSHVSANVASVLGVEVADLLGSEPCAVAVMEAITARVNGVPEDGQAFVPLAVEGPSGTFDALLSRRGNHVLIELEPAEAGVAESMSRFSLSGFMRVPATAEAMAEYYQSAVEAMRELSGFGRVLLYQFLDDGCGEVIAESGRDDMPSYKGLRFPASDIPQIARDLYVITRQRLIPEVGAEPVAIVGPAAVEELDLTLSDLRSVSPVHMEYLGHMGVASSFSVALVIQRKLWGLFACHDLQPRHIGHERRRRCVDLAQAVGMGVMGFDSGERLRFMDRVDNRIQELVERVARSDGELDQALADQGDALMELLEAGGGAVIGEAGPICFGDAPALESVIALDEWLSAYERSPYFQTDELSRLWSGGAAIARCASGVIALRIDLSGAALPRLYLFRPEQPEIIHWAGDPRKGGENLDPDLPLSPRSSFDTWTETRRQKAPPWTLRDQMAAKKLRTGLLLGARRR